MKALSSDQDILWHRIFFKGTLILFAVCILAVLFFSFFGDAFIESLYSKTSLGMFNKIIRGQNDLSLHHYLVLVNTSLKGLVFFCILFFPVCFILLSVKRKAFFLKLLWLMVWVDICFIILHITYKNLWVLNRDFFIPELFLYLQELLIVVLCALFFIRSKQKIYFVFTLIFLFILVDDSFGVHERIGTSLARTLDLRSISEKIGTYSSQHIGEFLFLSIVGGLLALLFMIVYRKTDNVSRYVALGLFKLLFLFAFFAVVVDLLHGMIAMRYVHGLIGLIESGGEMIVISLILVTIFKYYVLFRRTEIKSIPAGYKSNDEYENQAQDK